MYSTYDLQPRCTMKDTGGKPRGTYRFAVTREQCQIFGIANSHGWNPRLRFDC